jgi:serine protease Do
MKSLTPFVVALSLFSLGAAAPTVSAAEKEFNRETPLVLAIRKVKPSIISIKVERQGNWGKKEGIGTGVIFDERGYAVTNRHVIGGAVRVHVALADKSECLAQVMVEDIDNDIAILKLPAGKKYQALVFGPGSDLMEGETVIAIGHPYGYTNTVSTGIISALGREIVMPGDVRLINLIQHSACINPGNSGGPLVNINGEWIGLNVALREGAQAIGFALNADTVKKVLAGHMSAAKIGKVNHGLTCNELVQAHGRDRQKVVVEKVAGKSVADEAGLKTGDVIVKLGDRAISNRLDIERAFWDVKPGDKIEATVLRAGQATHVALVVNRDSGVVAAATETSDTPGAVQVAASPR